MPAIVLAKQVYSGFNDVDNDKRLGQLEVINKGAQNEYIKTTQFDAPFFDIPVLHLTQMYYIAIESLAKQNQDLNTAVNLMNALINRAYVIPSTLSSTATANEILTRVRQERRIELMFQGDRIHEIKRLGAIEGERMFVRGHEWNCPGMMMQFPITEKTDIFEINPTGGCN